LGHPSKTIQTDSELQFDGSILRNCGTQVLEGSRFCASCGQNLDGSEKTLANIIPIERVILMTVLSGGSYAFYWYYITWKQYRNHSEQRAFPVWHSLTLLVPIYGLFRTHAHMRTYQELMDRRNLANTINPSIAVGVVFAVGVLIGVSFALSLFMISEKLGAMLLVINVISTGILLWLVSTNQENLNRYWGKVFSFRPPSPRLVWGN